MYLPLLRFVDIDRAQFRTIETYLFLNHCHPLFLTLMLDFFIFLLLIFNRHRLIYFSYLFILLSRPFLLRFILDFLVNPAIVLRSAGRRKIHKAVLL